jgi:polar amino acid transport system substrate-binding protein
MKDSNSQSPYFFFFRRPVPRVMALLLCVLFISAQGFWCPAFSSDSVPQQKISHGVSDSHLAAAEFTPEERAWIAAHPSITVSNEFDWPPFDFVVSGKPQGFGIDLMNLLSEKSGISFKYINGYTWDELVEMFWQGEIDLLHSLSTTPEREKKAYLSAPYYHSKNVFILRRDTADTSDLEDLEGKIIALPKGWSSIEFFQKYYPEVHIIEVASSRQALGACPRTSQLNS